MGRNYIYGEGVKRCEKFTIPERNKYTLRQIAILLVNQGIWDKENGKADEEIVKIIEERVFRKENKIDLLPKSADVASNNRIKLVGSVPASFDETHAEYPHEVIDIYEKITENNSNSYNDTFLLEVDRENGESMTAAGIFPRDLLVVEKTVEAIHNDIVIATLGDAETTTVKRYIFKNSKEKYLIANSLNTEMNGEVHTEFDVIGVVRRILHDPKNRY